MAGRGAASTAGRTLLGLLVALVTAGVVWWTQGDDAGTQADPAPSDTPSVQTSAPTTDPTDDTGGDGATDPESGLPVVQVADLPPEAQEMLELIEEGGPFEHDEDGSIFENREELLPQQPSGYYKEYTVETPGSPDRGARRIVAGEGGELYWTDDHYRSFSRIAR